jgi:7-carboxy-7-deazaguanine synthase
MSSLRLTEIFYSLQGETRTVGLPTVFVRLTGCPLRCQYCDTAYAFSGGQVQEIEAILVQVASYTPYYVTVTGGEPLAQPNCLILLSQLCDAGYEVSLETSGAMDLSQVDPRVVLVMDLKTPGSTEESKNLWANLDHLKKTDQIKFVICHRADYEWAKQKVEEYRLTDSFQVLFSPSFHELEAAALADWILADRLNVRFQIQLHKTLWGDKPGV